MDKDGGFEAIFLKQSIKIKDGFCQSINSTSIPQSLKFLGNFPCQVLFCFSDCYFVIDPDEGVMDNAENVRDVVFVCY